MINFIGTYDCKADSKGRIMLPVALKNQMQPVLENGFVLKRSVFRSCLELYPMDEFNAMMLKLRKKSKFSKKNNDLVRSLFAGVKIIEIDATGRLLIPKELVKIAGITKEVTVSSAIDCLEIWDKDSYEKVLAETADDVAALAEEILGDDDNDYDND